MVALMMEIKNLKERNKHLTDEERRKNAEDMILKLS
jgi:FtsZ-binding cell division protein ZapB